MAELVEGAGLENQKGGNPFEGSNPSPSASNKNNPNGLFLFVETYNKSKTKPTLHVGFVLVLIWRYLRFCLHNSGSQS